MFSSASWKLLNMFLQIVGLFIEHAQFQNNFLNSFKQDCFKQFYGDLSMPVMATWKISLNGFVPFLYPPSKPKFSV